MIVKLNLKASYLNPLRLYFLSSNNFSAGKPTNNIVTGNTNLKSAGDSKKQILKTDGEAKPQTVFRNAIFEEKFYGLEDKAKESAKVNNYYPEEMQKARAEALKHKFGSSLYDTGSNAMQAAVFWEKTDAAVKYIHQQTYANDPTMVYPINLITIFSQKRKS